MLSGRAQLKAWIERSRLKQYEVAERLCLHDSHLSQILSGVRRPGLPIAVTIEDVTGIPVRSWLTTRRGRIVKPPKTAARKAQIGTELSHA